MGKEDTSKISTISDILSLKNIPEERSNSQLEVQTRRLGIHIWGFLALGVFVAVETKEGM